MRGLILFAAAIALTAPSACNQKKSGKKRGNSNATFPTTSTPQSTIPSTTNTSNLLNGRNCTSEEIFGSDSRRIVITAQPGVHQPSQMQIINSDGTSFMYSLQPAGKYWLMPRSDNYDVIPQSSGGFNSTNPYNNTNYNNQTGSGGVLGGLFGGNNTGSTGGDAGNVTVAQSGNVYLRGVQFYDNSSGTVEPKKITGKAVCN